MAHTSAPRNTFRQRHSMRHAPLPQPRRLALTHLAVLLFALVVAPAAAAATADDEPLWKAVRSPDHFVLIRHALAPGTGDPPGFRLRDCRTQRNLDEVGRAQARRIGERFRANGIQAAKVLSSQWCRCLETARLLGLGNVDELPALNSFFAKADEREPRRREMLDWMAQVKVAGPVVLVTHQVNITALTGVFPMPGEMVVVRRGSNGSFLVVGSIRADG